MAGSNVYLADSELAGTVRSVADIIASIDSGASANIHGTLCSWFAAQNKAAAESLFYQTTNTAASGANVEIAPLPGYKNFPPKHDKYDLREHFFRVQTDGNDFTIEVHWD